MIQSINILFTVTMIDPQHVQKYVPYSIVILSGLVVLCIAKSYFTVVIRKGVAMNNVVLYKGANLLDGTGRGTMKNTAMLVDGDRIVEIGSAEYIKTGENVAVVDLTGKTIMPGMINSHAHIIMEPVGDPFVRLASNSPTRTALVGAINMKKMLKAGFTYIRDPGARNFADVDLRKSVQDGLIEGPGLGLCGHILTMTGGQAWAIGKECDGPDEVRKAAREQLKHGCDFIKLMATGGVLSPGNSPSSCQQTYEEMRAGVEVAHDAGKKAAAHAHAAQGVMNAVNAGVDSIEHGVFLNEENIELMVRKGTYLVPTLAATYFIVKTGVEGGVPEFAVRKAEDVIQKHINSFKMAYKAGVKIALGTDAGTSFNEHGRSAVEAKLMVDYGVSPEDAVYFATLSGAKLLGIDDQYGSLEKGKKADFIVLGENPLENIETLMHVEQVYKHGKSVD